MARADGPDVVAIVYRRLGEVDAELRKMIRRAEGGPGEISLGHAHGLLSSKGLVPPLHEAPAVFPLAVPPSSPKAPAMASFYEPTWEPVAPPPKPEHVAERLGHAQGLHVVRSAQSTHANDHVGYRIDIRRNDQSLVSFDLRGGPGLLTLARARECAEALLDVFQPKSVPSSPDKY